MGWEKEFQKSKSAPNGGPMKTQEALESAINMEITGSAEGIRVAGLQDGEAWKWEQIGGAS